MKDATELLKKDKELQEIDEPSPPNAERKGLWRILAMSFTLAVIGLGIAWAAIF